MEAIPEKEVLAVKPVTTTAATAPAVRNMAEFKATPLYEARQTMFAGSFKPATKVYQYPDDAANVKLTVVAQPNPSFAGNSIVHKTTPYTGPKEADPAGQVCTTQQVQLTADSTSFLINDFANQASQLYPGAIFAWEDFTDGSYKEVVGARNPIVLDIDLQDLKPGASSFITVDSPAMGTIDTAVAALFSRTGSGHPASEESLVYQVYQSFTSSDLNMKISGGIGGYGIKLSDVFNSGQNNTERHITIDASKAMFSINTTPPDNGFFVDPSIEATPNLVAMCCVTYGIRVLANLDLTFSSNEEGNNFDASYSGFGVNANVGVDFFTKNTSTVSNINGFITGGPANAGIVNDPNTLISQIQTIVEGATYLNAKPISYQFFDMAGNVMGTQSNTEFPMRQCVPATVVQSLQSVMVTFDTSSDNKNADTHYTVDLLTFGNHVVATLSDNSNNDEYKNKTNITRQLTITNNPKVAYNDFYGRGGHLTLNITPNGNDEWDLSAIKLTMAFENNPHPVSEIIFTNLVISQSNRTLTLYFDGNFRPIQ